MFSCTAPNKMFHSRGVKYSCNHISFQFVLFDSLSIVVGGKLVLASPDSTVTITFDCDFRLGM